MAHVIVTGQDLIDIDMLAGVQCLFEALTLKGKEVYVHGRGTYTASITENLRTYISYFPEKEVLDEDDVLYAVDVSSTDYLQKKCGYPLEQFSKIFDHHFDSVEYWKERLEGNARIEEVGAAVTLVAEFTKEEGVWADITDDTKKLIAAGVISNSQNFLFSMTTNRDRDLYQEIAEEFSFSDQWPEEYLLSVQEEIQKDVGAALVADTKTKIPINDQSFGITQLEMWDCGQFLTKSLGEVVSFVGGDESEVSFFMSASLSENKTYFVAAGEDSKLFLTTHFGLVFNDHVAVMEKIMIRKEVIKYLVEKGK